MLFQEKPDKISISYLARKKKLVKKFMAIIKKTSLVDQVYERLRKDIISLQLPLGSKLNVNELQTKLGVSCTPIREAVNRLQLEGLVEYEVNVGAHVLTLNEHDVEEIQLLAMTLHKAAICLAMKDGDKSKIAADFKKHLKEYQAAKSIQSEVTAINMMVGTFYKNCGNKRLDKSMISIQGQQLLLRYAYANCRETRGADAANFAQILLGIQAGNVQTVCQALEEHAEQMTWELKKLFNSQN
ncbi:MAG: GntR family transcriptional regulator [Firmicutes bacterium]|nr:GntR family transcriptional regulator [Bacillota bacterium]